MDKRDVEMRDLLDWYASRAADLARYTSQEPPNTIAIASVVQELALDGGSRAYMKPIKLTDFKEKEQQIMNDYQKGLLTSLGVAAMLIRAGFNSKRATEIANQCR